MAGVGVVVGAQQGQLPAPVRPASAALRARALPERQRAVDAAVGRERAFPVLLEREQAVGRALGDGRAEEEPGVLDRISRTSLPVPTPSRPDRLVDIVVDAIGVADEAVGVRRDAIVSAA